MWACTLGTADTSALSECSLNLNVTSLPSFCFVLTSFYFRVLMLLKEWNHKISPLSSLLSDAWFLLTFLNFNFLKALI